MQNLIQHLSQQFQTTTSTISLEVASFVAFCENYLEHVNPIVDSSRDSHGLRLVLSDHTEVAAAAGGTPAEQIEPLEDFSMPTNRHQVAPLNSREPDLSVRGNSPS